MLCFQTMCCLVLLLLLLFHGATSVHRRVAREEGTRPETYFYHIEDGFHYHLNREAEGVSYYKCVYYERGCQGRAVYDIHDGFRHMQPHTTHEADIHYPDEMALRRMILQRCRALEYVAYRTILDQECRRFNAEVVARVTYGRMRTPMRNARLSRYPLPPPPDLRALTRLLMDPNYSVLTMSDDGTDNIYAGSVDSADGGHHVIFVTNRMVELMRQLFVLHSDGTFKTVPVNADFASQVFVIVGVWRHRVINLGWSLMESRSEVAYRSVLEFVRHLMGPNIALTRAITDFETGQQNAWDGVFGVIVQGCLWHLCRCFLHNVVDNNLLGRMRRIPELLRTIRMTFALALLPGHLIMRGYELILQHARNDGMFLFRLIRPFLLYVWTEWVSRPWRRERMCVFGSSQRTNNACECCNRMLRREVGTHPNIYVFLRGLVTLEQRAHNVYLALEAGNRPGPARKRTSVMNDNRLVELSEDLFNPPGPIDQSIFRFLRRASHLMDKMVEELFEGLERRAH